MTHVFQYELLDRYRGVPGTQPLEMGDPYYDWAALLDVAQSYYREAGVGSSHPNYHNYWIETSAFRAGDEALVFFAIDAQIDIYQILYEPGDADPVIARIDPRSVQFNDNLYKPGTLTSWNPYSYFNERPRLF